MDCEKGGKNMPQGMVHIENLVKRYGDLTALNHLDLDISGKVRSLDCLAPTVPEKQRPSAVCCPC